MLQRLMGDMTEASPTRVERAPGRAQSTGAAAPAEVDNPSVQDARLEVSAPHWPVLAQRGAGIAYVLRMQSALGNQAVSLALRAVDKKSRGRTGGASRQYVYVPKPSPEDLPEGTHQYVDAPPGSGKVSDEREAGNWVHKNWELIQEKLGPELGRFLDPVPSGQEAEARVPQPTLPGQGQPRIDRLDREAGVVTEFKPRHLYDQGLAEAKSYAQQMDKYERLPGGRRWQARCRTYDALNIIKYLREIGYLPPAVTRDAPAKKSPPRKPGEVKAVPPLVRKKNKLPPLEDRRVEKPGAPAQESASRTEPPSSVPAESTGVNRPRGETQAEPRAVVGQESGPRYEGASESAAEHAHGARAAGEGIAFAVNDAIQGALDRMELEKAQAEFGRLEPTVRHLNAQGKWVVVIGIVDVPSVPDVLESVYRDPRNRPRFVHLVLQSGDTREHAFNPPATGPTIGPSPYGPGGLPEPPPLEMPAEGRKFIDTLYGVFAPTDRPLPGDRPLPHIGGIAGVYVSRGAPYALKIDKVGERVTLEAFDFRDGTRFEVADQVWEPDALRLRATLRQPTTGWRSETTLTFSRSGLEEVANEGLPGRTPETHRRTYQSP